MEKIINFNSKINEILIKLKKGKNLVIIDGYMGVGKTILANLLAENIYLKYNKKRSVLHLDSYFKNFHNFKKIRKNKIDYNIEEIIKLTTLINDDFLIIEGINSKRIYAKINKYFNNYNVVIINILNNDWFSNEELYQNYNKKDAFYRFISKEKNERIEFSKRKYNIELTESLNCSFLTLYSQFKNYFKFKPNSNEINWLNTHS